MYGFNDMIAASSSMASTRSCAVSSLRYRLNPDLPPHTLAIGFNGTKDPKIVDTARLRDIAPFIEMDLRMVEREMRRPQHAL